MIDVIIDDNDDKPDVYRYFIFDIECSQDEICENGTFKHKPILVCGEMLCTACIDVGIQIDSKMNTKRPLDCICRGNEKCQGMARQWIVPNSDGRKFCFHNFDNYEIDSIGEMLEFLTNHSKCDNKYLLKELSKTQR